MPRLRTTLAVLAFVMFPTILSAQATTVFRGVPSVKVSEGGSERKSERVTADRAPHLAVVISRIGDRYYWASRENVELIPIEGGAFVTFVARNGSGYVRVIQPDMKQAASLMSDSEAQFDYVEHLVIGLRSVTYFGTSRPISP
jgi:hypothetical protein